LGFGIYVISFGVLLLWRIDFPTLLFGMLSNLMLLSALVPLAVKTLANEQDFIRPKLTSLNQVMRELIRTKK
jgi:hypothetical protein